MAQVDYFLKLKGIEGESEDDKHKNEISLESWSWGATQSGTHADGGGGGAGKVHMQDFHFTMKVNKASPKLFQHCATGQHIPDAQLTCRKAGKEQQEYLVYKFYDLLVASYQIGGSHGDLLPMEQISLNFAKFEVEYKPQKADGSLGGSIQAGYNQKTNKAS